MLLVECLCLAPSEAFQDDFNVCTIKVYIRAVLSVWALIFVPEQGAPNLCVIVLISIHAKANKESRLQGSAYSSDQGFKHIDHHAFYMNVLLRLYPCSCGLYMNNFLLNLQLFYVARNRPSIKKNFACAFVLLAVAATVHWCITSRLAWIGVKNLTFIHELKSLLITLGIHVVFIK